MAEKDRTIRPIAALAVFLAWLVPGAGHAYMGRPVRGVIIFLTITATFWAGIAMGGVMTVDPRSEKWWFMGQMITGVNGLVGWQAQDRYYGALRPRIQKLMTSWPFDPNGGSPPQDIYIQTVIDAVTAEDGTALVPPVETAARAYSGVAGLLNLMCIFDALMLGLMGHAGEPAPAEKQKSPLAREAAK